MLNQEQIHRYFNHLSGAKRIEFLYGLLHLCQPLELRYLGTCLEEIARKDYEYLYHAEQKTNHLPTSTSTDSGTHPASSSSSSSVPTELLVEEKLDLTDQFTRAHAIVDIALLWAKNRACAIRLFRRLKASESVKLVDMLLERDDLDDRVMDEILIIFCLAANHPAFSFDMRTQMSQILKELEKRQRKMKLLKPVHPNPTNNINVNNDEETLETLDESSCLRHHLLSSSSSSSLLNSSTFSVHASPLLTRLAVVNCDTDSSPMRILIKADWSDNNSTLTWKTPNDIRSFHLQVSGELSRTSQASFVLAFQYRLSRRCSIGTPDEYIRLFTRHRFSDGTRSRSNEEEYWHLYDVGLSLFDSGEDLLLRCLDIWSISPRIFPQSLHWRNSSIRL